jgi:hypothetical protein
VFKHEQSGKGSHIGFGFGFGFGMSWHDLTRAARVLVAVGIIAYVGGELVSPSATATSRVFIGLAVAGFVLWLVGWALSLVLGILRRRSQGSIR